MQASVDLTVSVCKVDGDNCNTVDALQDGTYTLESNAIYRITYVPGYAENGYYSVLYFRNGETTNTVVTPLIKHTDTESVTYGIDANLGMTLSITKKWAKSDGTVYEAGDNGNSILSTTSNYQLGEPPANETMLLSETTEAIESSENELSDTNPPETITEQQQSVKQVEGSEELVVTEGDSQLAAADDPNVIVTDEGISTTEEKQETDESELSVITPQSDHLQKNISESEQSQIVTEDNTTQTGE